MKITMTLKEMAAYAGMGIEISGMKTTVAEAMKDVFALAGDPQKYGFTEIGIDDNMDIYVEIDPKATVKIIEIFTKYIKAIMPLLRGLIETMSGLQEGLQKDMEELVSMFEEPEEKSKTVETNFYKTDSVSDSETTNAEDFSEVENPEAKAYTISTIDFDDEEEVTFKKWYNDEHIDIENIAAHETMDVYLKGLKYAKIVIERKLGETNLIISDFECYKYPNQNKIGFVSKLFNKITTTLDDHGYDIQIEENLAKELADKNIIKLG